MLEFLVFGFRFLVLGFTFLVLGLIFLGFCLVCVLWQGIRCSVCLQ